jgi:hypothetical protein
MSVPPSPGLDPAQAACNPDLVWYHPVFCQFALPVAETKGSWRREAGSLALAIETASPDQPTASGWCLRLLLMHLCDQAVRTGNPAVEMGADAAALAATLGLPQTEPVLQQIAEQAERMVGAKLTVTEGQATLGVLDARGQSRRAAAEWRLRIRLNARFHASLVERAVALDRRIVTALAAEPLALDAHAWIRHLLQHQPAGETATVPWGELLKRFGLPGQDLAAFRAGFEDALRMVFAADFSISLAADDEGVTVGVAAPQAEVPAAAPAPVEMPSEVSVKMPVAMPAQVAAEAPQPERAPRRREQAPRREPEPEPVAAAQAPRPPAAPEPYHAAPRTNAPVQQAPMQQASVQRPEAGGAIRIGSHLTGLPVVIWLRRGDAHEQAVIAATPGTRMDPDRLTLLMLEPLIMQVSGGLNQGEFDKVSAWAMANRDLIDQVWEGEIGSFEEVASRVKKVPAPGWR